MSIERTADGRVGVDAVDEVVPSGQLQTRRRAWLKLLQVAATGGAFAYLFTTVDWNQFGAAYARASLVSFLGACGVYYLAIMIATFRWKLLLVALGVTERIPYLRLLRLYVVGQFYNTYVPGGVGGDVVRALAIREHFGARGAAGSLATVLIERAMGLGGMLVVVASTTLLFPLVDLEGLAALGIVGLVLAVAGFACLAFARRLVLISPRPLAGLLARLPVVEHYGPVLPAIGISLVTHLLAALAGHVLIVNVAPQVVLTQSLAIVPLALASAYLPISIGGVGVVELAMVQLLRVVGIPEADATVAALMMRMCQWAVSAPGGFLVLLSPRRVPATR